MNSGTKIRTALAVAIALYVALIKTDLTTFGNATVDLIYQIAMKVVTFVVIFIVTYYNQDYTEEACQGTGLTRYLKALKKAGYIGDEIIDVPEIEEEGDEDE